MKIKSDLKIPLGIVLCLSLTVAATFASLPGRKIIPSSGQINYSLTRLHVDGRYLKDAMDNVIYLRGVVKGVASDVYPGGNWPREGGGDDSGWNNWDADTVRWHLQNMRSFGFTVWRCFGWNLRMWKFRETSSDANLAVQHMQEAIQIANEVGLYVVVAPYAVSNERAIEGEDRETLPIPPYIGTSRGQETIASKQDFIDIWVEIAQTLDVYPNVLFELYNEPDYADWYNSTAEGRQQQEDDWFTVMQQTIDAIRQVSLAPIVIQWYKGLWYNDYRPESEQPRNLRWVKERNITGTNIVISTHTYRTYGGLGHIDGEVPHTYEQLEERLGFLLQDVYLTHPVFVGEIGVNTYLTGAELTEELEAWNNTLQIFGKWGISYTAFTWKSTGMFSIFEDDPWLPPLNAAGEILVNVTKSN